MLGQGKKGYILFDKEPEKWDIMYQFATGIFFEKDELIEELLRVTQIKDSIFLNKKKITFIVTI